MYLLQKARFESLYAELSSGGGLYLGAFRFPAVTSDHWVLAMTLQLNYWFLGAQRGGLRQFRHLETLQAYVLDTLGADAFSVQNHYPDHFPRFDYDIGIRAHPIPQRAVP